MSFSAARQNDCTDRRSAPAMGRGGEVGPCLPVSEAFGAQRAASASRWSGKPRRATGRCLRSSSCWAFSSRSTAHAIKESPQLVEVDRADSLRHQTSALVHDRVVGVPRTPKGWRP